MTRTITLSAIYHYPIKSCRGSRLESARVDAYGLEMDRRWMVVDQDGHFLTQRQHPRMALIEPTLTPDALRLRAPGMEEIRLPLSSGEGDGTTMDVTIWGDRCTAMDEGSEAATWFSDYLGLACRLVRMGRHFIRPVKADYAVAVNNDQVSFADAFPFLLISAASLEDLNAKAKLALPLEMDRFRPNLVVSGCAPFEEDRWRVVQIGEMIFHVVKPCARCTVTTVDQSTGERGEEPLATLATYRQSEDGKVLFGVNLIHETKSGQLHVGSGVKVFM